LSVVPVKRGVGDGVAGALRHAGVGVRPGHPAHPVDAASVHAGDPQGAAPYLDPVADGRHPTKPRHQVAADRLVRSAVRDVGADPLAQLVRAPEAGHDPAAVAQPPAARAAAVVLVGHLADDLFDNVLEGRDAGRAAVLVDHDGELQACDRSCCSRGSSPTVSGTIRGSDARAMAGTSARRSCGTAIARLTCTTPTTSSRPLSTIGKREWPVVRASRTTSAAESSRLTTTHCSRGVMTSAAVARRSRVCG
jgi:hypothetical protein